MFGIVDQWRKSGTTKKIFAQKAQLTKSKLEYWIRKRNASESPDSPEFTCPEFIEVCSNSSHLESKVREKMPSSENLQIELTFPSGLCLKIFG